MQLCMHAQVQTVQLIVVWTILLDLVNFYKTEGTNHENACVNVLLIAF